MTNMTVHLNIPLITNLDQVCGPIHLPKTMLDQAGVSLHAKSCTIESVFPFQHLVVNRKCGTANSFVNKADFNDCFIVRQFSLSQHD